MNDEIQNKVAQSGIKSFDLEAQYPSQSRVIVDLEPWLFEGIILREKEFRQFVKDHDWSIYSNKFIAINCSADAIIPTWAYMIVASALANYTLLTVVGDAQALEQAIALQFINGLNFEPYKDQRVVIKGCSKIQIPLTAFAIITQQMQAVAKSVMFGEPCSTVPIYKRKG